ncbi:MAG: prepilin-type N-terminal cleavage/methylation domain-containing protein [Thermoanaerobaculum sp.]
MKSFRSCGFSGRLGQRGVTLVELLVVLVLVATIALVGGLYLSSFFQKQRLASVAQEVKAFLAEAPNFVQRLQQPVFVRFVPPSGTQPPRLQIARDLTGSQVLRQYIFTPEIVFSFTSPAAISCNWPNVSGAYVLRLDLTGRTTDPSTNNQVQQVENLLLVHRNMVTGSLQPKRGFEIAVAPVWEVRMTVKFP